MRPKYEALRSELLDLVTNKAAGDQIPPERELCDQFNVARETLRRALDDLARDGYLIRRQGAGTFVARPKLTQQFRVRSFTEDMQARGFTSASKLLWHDVHPAGARIGSDLQLSPTELVVTLRRVRLADGEPMALELLHTPYAVIPNLDPEELADRSFYEYLRAHGVTVAGGSQSMEPTVTDPADSELLSMPSLSPALEVHRVTWTSDGQRIESTTSLYRGDRYKFHIELTE